MRLSLMPDDPGFEVWNRFRDKWPFLVVYLAGQRIERDVVTVDDQEGFVVRYQRDDSGQFVLTPTGFGGDVVAQTETLYGQVTIEFRSC